MKPPDERGVVARPPGEPERTQRLAVLEGGFATVHIAITAGPLVTAYALFLGATAFHLGILSAVIALSAVGSVVGAQAVGFLGERRRLTVVTSIAGRAMWVVLCALPFLSLPQGARLGLFVAVVFIGNALTNVAGAAWISWMSDLVPIERRGRYFGIRSAILGAIGMAVGVVTGRAYDVSAAHGQTGIGLAWIFGAASLFAILSGWTLQRQWEPPLRGERPRRIIETLSEPLANGRFRRLLTFLVLWSVATGIAAPFFAAHMITNLHFTLAAMALYSIISGAVNLALMPFWGRVIDHLGNRPVLVANMVGIGLLPLLWLFATPSHLLPIWIDAFLTGIFWPGFTLANFNLLLATAPEKSRTSYLGVQNVAVGLPAFAASLLGGGAAALFAGMKIAAHGQTFVNFHVLFAASALMRLALIPVALRLHEKKAQNVAALLDFVGDEISLRFSQGTQAGVAIVKAIGDVGTRIGDVGTKIGEGGLSIRLVPEPRRRKARWGRRDSRRKRVL